MNHKYMQYNFVICLLTASKFKELINVIVIQGNLSRNCCIINFSHKKIFIFYSIVNTFSEKAEFSCTDQNLMVEMSTNGTFFKNKNNFSCKQKDSDARVVEPRDLVTYRAVPFSYWLQCYGRSPDHSLAQSVSYFIHLLNDRAFFYLFSNWVLQKLLKFNLRNFFGDERML